MDQLSEQFAIVSDSQKRSQNSGLGKAMNYKTVLTAGILLSATTLSLSSLAISPQVAAPKWDDPDAIEATRARIEIKDSDTVEISADIPGTIIKLIPQEKGGVVEEGQVVVELDSRLVEAELLEANFKAESTVLIDFADHALEDAKLKLASKTATNERSKERTGEDLYTPDEMRQLALDVVKAEAELAKSKEDKQAAELARNTKKTQLSQYTRTATKSGIVTDMHKKSVGSAVRQGDPIMTIVNLDRVTAVCLLDMSYEDRVNVGDTVLIRRTLRSNNGTASSLRSGDARLTGVTPQTNAKPETFVGKVTFINPVKSADKDNSFEIEAVIQNKSTGVGKFMLRKGSFVEAVVVSPR